jgi:hypothetical protein
MDRPRAIRSSTAGLTGALFLLCCYRAATQSFVHDEALTFQLYIATPLSNIFDVYDANHHFLFTLLERLSAALFGYAELALRLPTIAAALLYFWSVRRAVLFTFGETLWAVLAAALLSLNPLLLDFLVAARGYGLALALFFFGLTEVLLAVSPQPAERNRRKGLALGGAAVGLSVAANLTFLFPVAGAALVTLLLLRKTPGPTPTAARRAGKKQRPLVKEASGIWAFLTPLAAVLFLFFLAAPVSKARTEDFYAGTTSPSASLESLRSASFEHNEGLARLNGNAMVLVWWRRVAGLLFLPGALLWGAAIALRRLRQPGALPRQEAFLALVCVPAVGSSLLLALAHFVFGLPYPVDRTGLYFLPLAGAAACTLAAMARGGTQVSRNAASVAGFLCVLVVICYVIQLNWTHFAVWRYDADTKRLLAGVAHRFQEASPASVRAGVSWQLEPSSNYYRMIKQWQWLQAVRRDPSGADSDFYLLLSADAGIVAQRSLTIEERGVISGTTLAVPTKP